MHATFNLLDASATAWTVLDTVCFFIPLKGSGTTIRIVGLPTLATNTFMCNYVAACAYISQACGTGEDLVIGVVVCGRMVKRRTIRSWAKAESFGVSFNMCMKRGVEA